MLIIVPPILLDGDYIDYPWAADTGALYCAARAASAGWNVRVFDSLAQSDSGWHLEPGPDGPMKVAGIPFSQVSERVVSSVGDFVPDLLVVVNHPFLWASRKPGAAMTGSLADSFSGTPVVLSDCAVGGMLYVEHDPKELLAAFPGTVAVVTGSGESVFADPDSLLSAVAQKRNVLHSPAVPWTGMSRDIAGKVCGVPVMPLPMWDAIDIGARHAFNVRFFDHAGRPNPFGVGAGSLPLLASAGCAHDCVFCTTNPGRENHGPGAYRIVPLDVLSDQLYLMKRAFACRHVLFLDDAANLRPDFEKMLELLDRMGFTYDFPNGLRADRLNERMIELMAGHVNTLSVSCETADAEALISRDKVGKGLRPEDVENVASLAAKHKVGLMVHYIIGFPWESLTDVRGTLDFARLLFEKHGAMPAVQFATPVEGSRLSEMLRQAGIPFVSGDVEAFQHRPSFVPAAMKAGDLEAAMSAFNSRIEASRPTKVIINVTYECVNECEFCAVSNRVRRAIPVERIMAILDEHRSQGIENVDFDGGEPMLHADILEVVRHAVAIGYRQVNITSNGRKLADRELAGRLVASGVTSVLISLHADDASVHDAITRRRGSHEETLAGIDNVMAAISESGRDVDFGVNVTICRRNVGNLHGLARMMADRGVAKMNFQFLTPFGSASAGLVPDQEAAARIVEGIIDDFGDRMAVYVVNSQLCLFRPGYRDHLMNDLQKLGRTMVFVWEEEVNLFRYLAERRERRQQCMDCPHFPVCDGFYVFPESGNETMEDGCREE